eukprot:Gb_34278 [translate_table: standard]
MNISPEQGKTLGDARGSVFHGLEIVEYACNMATLQMGECNNTYLMKSSEKNPRATMLLAEMAMEVGLPVGVLNIIHSTHDVVNDMYDNPDIKVISIIGSNGVGMHIYVRASAKGKRVQSNLGAKIHAIIMLDANIDTTLNALANVDMGAVCEQYMALSTVVFVGGSKPSVKGQREHARQLKVNVCIEFGVDLGLVISKQAKCHICSLIASGVKNGARFVHDGRSIEIANSKEGNFVGLTILVNVTNDT